MENKQFDDFIRRAMENLDGENYVPQDWSSMEEHLDADLDGFDQFIAHAVSNLDGEKFVPMDWARMEDKLDAAMDAEVTAESEQHPEMEDIYLDAVAYEHLHSIEPPYNKAHWEMMSARLDAEYTNRRRVVFMKILEVAVVLLLVWTAINFFPTQKIKVAPEAPIATTPEYHNNTNNLSSLPSSPIISDRASIAENSSEIIVESLPNVTTVRDDFFPAKIKIEPSTIASNSTLTKTAVPASLRQATQIIEKKKERPSLQFSNPEMTIAENSGSILEEKVLVKISPLPALISSFLEIEEDPNNKFTYADLFKKKKIRTHEVFFSMFTSANLDYVQSDFYNDKVRELDVYQRGRFGYGGGFALGFQLNKLLVETGVSYAFLSYQQREEANIIGSFAEGYVEEQWEDAELEMLQVPLNFQYSFLERKNWKMYSLTGVSLNMALRNNFNFQVEGKTTATRAPVTEQSTIANAAANYKGIFEGGNFRENSYLSANLGFGLERKLTYRWSLYVQPVYRHYILFEGIGPNQDRIHSGSLRIGAKVQIR